MDQPAAERRRAVLTGTEALPVGKIWSAEEYLDFERRSPDKHELARGKVIAMAGANRKHNLLVANVVHLLVRALVDRPCEAYPSDMRVKVPATSGYVYPDATALCGRPEFEDREADTLTNPQLIVEVLSDSTEDYDRGDKFELYRSIDTFKEYMLVSQKQVLVEHFTRQAGGSWTKEQLGAGDRVEISSIRCRLEVNEIYLKVLGAPRQAAL